MIDLIEKTETKDKKVGGETGCRQKGRGRKGKNRMATFPIGKQSSCTIYLFVANVATAVSQRYFTVSICSPDNAHVKPMPSDARNIICRSGSVAFARDRANLLACPPHEAVSIRVACNRQSVSIKMRRKVCRARKTQRSNARRYFHFADRTTWRRVPASARVVCDINISPALLFLSLLPNRSFLAE